MHKAVLIAFIRLYKVLNSVWLDGRIDTLPVWSEEPARAHKQGA